MATPRERPVGDRLQPARDRDPERVRGLVARVVIAGKPGRRALRLAGDEGAVVGPNPAILEAVGIADEAGAAVIAHDGHEPPALRQPCPRPDDQLLGVAAMSRAGAVDVDRADRRAAIVEIEGAQVRARGRRDPGPSGEQVVARLVLEPQVVVVDLVAAVAGLGEDGVAEPGGAGVEPGGRLRSRRQVGTRGERHGDRDRPDGRAADHRSATFTAGRPRPCRRCRRSGSSRSRPGRAPRAFRPRPLLGRDPVLLRGRGLVAEVVEQVAGGLLELRVLGLAHLPLPDRDPVGLRRLRGQRVGGDPLARPRARAGPSSPAAPRPSPAAARRRARGSSSITGSKSSSTCSQTRRSTPSVSVIRSS